VPENLRLTGAQLDKEPPGQRGEAATSSKGSGDVRRADLELVRRCRAGDADAFEDLYRQHAGRLFNLTSRMVGTAQEAEDVLQDIFLLAYRKLDSFRGESSLGTWLYRLGMNQCLDHLRGRHARMNQATDSLDAEGAETPVEPLSSAPLAVNRMDLERAIGRLPEGCRAAFLLHDVEGFEHREIAAILGVSEGTSKSQLHKARRKLRALLSPA
jgi:RNA polymerase sigma-70 factor (ECF subfamily)